MFKNDLLKFRFPIIITNILKYNGKIYNSYIELQSQIYLHNEWFSPLNGCLGRSISIWALAIDPNNEMTIAIITIMTIHIWCTCAKHRFITTQTRVARLRLVGTIITSTHHHPTCAHNWNYLTRCNQLYRYWTAC